jgi:hypothetical protein
MDDSPRYPDDSRIRLPGLDDAAGAEEAGPVDCLARALQPLVASFQEHGVGVGDWVQAIKIAAYRAARDATDAESGRAIFSRMSVRTGMTRTELQQLRLLLRSGHATGAKRIGRQRTARVVEGWCGDPEFCDEHGQPRALALLGATDSVAAVVRRFAGDVPVTTAIAELRRQRLLLRQRDGRYLPGEPPSGLAVLHARRLELLMPDVMSQLALLEAAQLGPRARKAANRAASNSSPARQRGMASASATNQPA